MNPIIMMHCPYNHDGEAVYVKVKSPRFGKEHLASLQGIQCGNCKRIYVFEAHIFPIFGGIDYLVVDQWVKRDLYEQDGPWIGAQIELFTKDEN